MRKHLVWVLAVGIVLATGPLAPALGQINPFDDTLNLTKEDIAMINQAARQALDGEAVGTVVEWSNDKSGNAGSVTLLRNFEHEGRECREVQHLIDPKDSQLHTALRADQLQARGRYLAAVRGHSAR